MEGEEIALIGNYRKCGLEYHLDCIKYGQTKLAVLFITDMTICMQIYSQINSGLVELFSKRSSSCQKWKMRTQITGKAHPLWPKQVGGFIYRCYGNILGNSQPGICRFGDDIVLNSQPSTNTQKAHSNSKQSALILAQTSWRFGTLLLWVPACQIVGRCGLFWRCYCLNNDSTTKIDKKRTEIPQKVHHFWANKIFQFVHYHYGYQHVKVQPERSGIGVWVNITNETKMWCDPVGSGCAQHISVQACPQLGFITGIPAGFCISDLVGLFPRIFWRFWAPDHPDLFRIFWPYLHSCDINLNTVQACPQHDHETRMQSEVDNWI